MKAEHIDSKKNTDPNKVRNMQMVLSYAMREISKQVQVECSDRAVLMNILWLTIIKETNNIAKLYEKIADEKIAQINSTIKTHVSHSESLSQKIKELQDTIAAFSEREKRKESIITMLQEEKTVLHERIKKISEIFEGIMKSKSEVLRVEMEKQKDFLIKSVNDTTLNFLDEYSGIKKEHKFIDEAISVDHYQTADQFTQSDPLSKEALRELKEVSKSSKGKLFFNSHSSNPMLKHDMAGFEPSLRRQPTIMKYQRKYILPTNQVGINVCLPITFISEEKMRELNTIEIRSEVTIRKDSDSNLHSIESEESSKSDKESKDSKTATPLNELNKATSVGPSKDKQSNESSVGGSNNISRSVTKKEKKNKSNPNGNVYSVKNKYHSYMKKSSFTKQKKKEIITTGTKKLVINNNIDKIKHRIDFKKDLNNIISSSLKGLLDNEHLALIKERILKQFEKEEKKVKHPTATKDTPIATTTNSPLQSNKKNSFNESKKEANEKSTNTKNEPEEDQEMEPSYLHMDEVVTELPHKILATLERLSTKITSLGTNEYGDYVLDSKSADPKVEKIKQHANVLSTLLEKLYDTRPKEKSNMTIMFSRETMTEALYFPPPIPDTINANRPRSQEHKKAQVDFIPYKQYIAQRKAINMLNQSKINVTEFQPFKFIRLKQKARVHPVYNLISDIVLTYKNSKNYRNLMPIKTLVKSIMAFYNEKIAGSKDSSYFKNQRLSEFVYNSLSHRYGLQQVAERKFLEVNVTAFHLSKKAAMVNIFTKFMGIDDIYYTNDDLNFYFLMSVSFQQECLEKTILCKKEHIFSMDLPIQRKVKNLFDLVSPFFTPKLSKEELDQFNYRVRRLSKKEQEIATGKDIVESELDERLLNVDMFMSECIDQYREIKLSLQKKLYDKAIIQRVAPYDDDTYSKQEV